MSSVKFIATTQPSPSITYEKYTAQQTATTQPQFAANAFSSATISQAARDALAAAFNSAPSANSSTTHSVNARLAEIQSKGPINRTAEENDYLWTNDPGLAAIKAKSEANPNYSFTAAELDHAQKTTGLVNTMANLSLAEKDLYDKAVASGNKEAAAGIGEIGLIRMMGHMAGGASGTTYDPINTAITPENIVKYFMNTSQDPSGRVQSQFQALINFLENRPTASS
jgi:hypothetical protein